MYDAYVFTSRIRTYQKLLIFPIWKHQKRTTSTHTRALVHLCDTLILTQFISNAIESVHHRLCVYYECPSMTIYQYLALKSLFLTDDGRTENVRTMNHKSTCNAHHHRLYEVLCISQLCDDFPISGHFLFRFFPFFFHLFLSICNKVHST